MVGQTPLEDILSCMSGCLLLDRLLVYSNEATSSVPSKRLDILAPGKYADTHS